MRSGRRGRLGRLTHGRPRRRRRPAAAARAARMKRSTLAGSFRPGVASTPELTSTPHGRATRTASPTVSGVSPADRITRPRGGRLAGERPGDRGARLALAPAGMAVEEERRGLVAVELGEIVRLADLDRLQHGPRHRRHDLGRLRAVELHGAEPALGDDGRHVRRRVVPEDAHRAHEGRQARHDRRRGGGRDVARRALHEDEPEGVRARLGRPEGVVEGRDPADLDAQVLMCPSSSRSFPAGSPLRDRDSPTRTAWAPAARTRRTSARVAIPLSDTTQAPGRRAGREPLGGREVGPERREVPVVEPDEAGAEVGGALELGLPVDLHQRREPEPLRGLEEVGEPVRLEDRAR